MFIVLDKECYESGDVIEGRIFFEMFIPSFQTQLMLKVEGTECFPSRLWESVFEEMMIGSYNDFSKALARNKVNYILL